MKIIKLKENIIEVGIANKDSVTINVSAYKDSLGKFICFFKQLASAQGMSINDRDFIETIDEDIIKLAYEATHPHPQCLKSASYFNIFTDANDAWENSGLENIVKGQTVRGIHEDEYDFIQTIKGKIDPQITKRREEYQQRKEESFLKQQYKGEPLGKVDFPVIFLEDTYEHFVN
jgi:hypothetical protein